MAKGALTLAPYAALAAAFLPYWIWLARAWAALSIEHTITCVLTLPMTAGLVWLARDPAASPEPAPRSAWMALVATGLTLHAAALVSGASGLSGIGLPIALAGVVLRVHGRKWLGRTWMPIAFLTFLLPLPWLLHDSLSYPAQRASAITAFLLASLSPLDAKLRGVYVYTDQFYVLVNDTCSGISSACALLMLALVAGQLKRLPLRPAMILIAVVLPIGLLANGGRIAFLLLMGHHWGLEGASALVHDLSALLFFAGAYVALFWGARTLAPEVERVSEASTASTAQENASPVV